MRYSPQYYSSPESKIRRDAPIDGSGHWVSGASITLDDAVKIVERWARTAEYKTGRVVADETGGVVYTSWVGYAGALELNDQMINLRCQIDELEVLIDYMVGHEAPTLAAQELRDARLEEGRAELTRLRDERGKVMREIETAG